MSGREWWPACLVDEIVPPGRARPEDWLAPDATGVTTLRFDDDDERVASVFDPGAVVDFVWHEDLGRIEIIVFADGTWMHDKVARCPATPDMFTGRPDRLAEAGAPPDPAKANLFAWPEDHEMQADSLDAFAAEWAAMEALPAEGVIVQVDLHHWSDHVKFRVSADGRSLTPVEKEESSHG